MGRREGGRVRKFGKYFFRWLDLSRDFWVIQNNLKIRGNARTFGPRSSAKKVQPTKRRERNTSFVGGVGMYVVWCRIRS